MYASREILSRGKILADLEKMKKTRGFFPTRIFPFTVYKKRNRYVRIYRSRKKKRNEKRNK